MVRALFVSVSLAHLGYKRSVPINMNNARTFILTDLFILSLYMQDIPDEFLLSPRRPSNYWINNGGWVGKHTDIYLHVLIGDEYTFQMAQSTHLIFTSPTLKDSVHYSTTLE